MNEILDLSFSILTITFSIIAFIIHEKVRKDMIYKYTSWWKLKKFGGKKCWPLW